MKRLLRILLGLMIVTTVYYLPTTPLGETKRVLEAIVVAHLFLEALKR